LEVKELIEELKKCPEDCTVQYDDDGFNYEVMGLRMMHETTYSQGGVETQTPYILLEGGK
jgi:hypothetical protein